jgi:hypothetical protein
MFWVFWHFLKEFGPIVEGGRIELPLLRRKKWRESFYGSLGRCLKGDPQQEVNGHHSGSLDCTVVGLGEI